MNAPTDIRALDTETNHAPVLVMPIPPISVTSEETVELSLSGRFEDPDGDHLSFGADRLPPGSTFSPDEQRFFWCKPIPGNYQVYFYATDDGLPPLTTTTKFSVSINQIIID